MDQPTLLDSMTRLAEEQCSRLVADAEREARRLLDAAREEAEARRTEELANAERETAERIKHDRARAEAGAAKQTLVMQEVVVDEVLQTVQQKIARFAQSEAFASALKSLLAEAVRDALAERTDIPNEEFVVTVPAAFVAPSQAWLKELDLEDVPVNGDATLHDGVIVADRAHTFRIVNTLTARYERLRDEARTLCLRRLSGAEGAAHGA